MRNNFHDGVLLDGRFQTVSPLNHGSFGMVFKAIDTWTGKAVAVKCLTKASAAALGGQTMMIDDRSEELDLHQQIGSHPNIVDLVHHFETEHHTYLVLEFCANGDLYEAIRVGKGPGQTENIRDCMLQLVSAVEHMHAQKVFHRDIKPENIFLSQDGALKLGDFGLATRDTWSFENAVGSDRYMAPEQYEHSNTGYSPAKADVWAIGICLLNVLFSRNPFAAPAFSDPLFADFVNDRQTLFDVFPNMSQDTYEILSHCLALDPAKRSLAVVKAYIKRAVSFTTDEEEFDDFCVDDSVNAGVTVNREPLRTPSISTPQFSHGGAFPWARALAMSPAMPVRQLSVIPDNESLFSVPSKQDWFVAKPETPSVASFVDSGLGVSLKSVNDKLERPKLTRTKTKPMPISGSLPISMGRPIPSMASVFGAKKRELVSKSWSDLWDEDEEEGHDFHFELDGHISEEDEQKSEQDTPRAPLAEIKNEAVAEVSRTPTKASTPATEAHVSEFTGFIFEEHVPTPPATETTSESPIKGDLLDRWAALGELRRGETPRKAAQPFKVYSDREETPRKRNRTKSWKKGDPWSPSAPLQSAPALPTNPPAQRTQQTIFGGYKAPSRKFSSKDLRSASTNNKDWNKSRDWRVHSSAAAIAPTTTNAHATPNIPTGINVPRHCHDGAARPFDWVWRNNILHL